MLNSSKNYKWIRVSDNKIAIEHRVIMENHIGRKLRSDEVVHHIDGNGKNNDIVNLKLMDLVDHSKSHSKPKPMIDVICSNCGIVFQIQLSYYNRCINKGQIEFFHNKSCASKGKIPPVNKKYTCDIEIVIRDGLNLGLSGYEISKRSGLNNKTVYSWIKKMKAI